jgi:hypothetical protein
LLALEPPKNSTDFSFHVLRFDFSNERVEHKSSSSSTFTFKVGNIGMSGMIKIFKCGIQGYSGWEVIQCFDSALPTILYNLLLCLQSFKQESNAFQLSINMKTNSY